MRRKIEDERQARRCLKAAKAAGVPELRRNFEASSVLIRPPTAGWAPTGSALVATGFNECELAAQATEREIDGVGPAGIDAPARRSRNIARARLDSNVRTIAVGDGHDMQNIARLEAFTAVLTEATDHPRVAELDACLVL